MAFGLVGDPIGEISPKAKLRNFLTSIIRHVIFKNRYIDFGGKEIAKLVLKTKLKIKLKNNLLIRGLLTGQKIKGMVLLVNT